MNSMNKDNELVNEQWSLNFSRIDLEDDTEISEENENEADLSF